MWHGIAIRDACGRIMCPVVRGVDAGCFGPDCVRVAHALRRAVGPGTAMRRRLPGMCSLKGSQRCVDGARDSASAVCVGACVRCAYVCVCVCVVCVPSVSGISLHPAACPRCACCRDCMGPAFRRVVYDWVTAYVAHQYEPDGDAIAYGEAVEDILAAGASSRAEG